MSDPVFGPFRVDRPVKDFGGRWGATSDAPVAGIEERIARLRARVEAREALFDGSERPGAVERGERIEDETPTPQETE